MIADGITALEGNGPLQGSPRQLGKIVLADDPVTADATCARLMGFDPLPVRHLSEGGPFPWEPSRGPYQDVGGRSRSTDAPVFGTAGIPLPPSSEKARERTAGKSLVSKRVLKPSGMRESGVPAKTNVSVVPVCQGPNGPSASLHCVQSRRQEGRRKNGSLEKSVAVPLANPISPPLGERARPGGHEEKWFRTKIGVATGVGPALPDLGLKGGDEEKWFL